MAVSPVTLLEHFVSELKALFPASGNDQAYRIHASFGVPSSDGAVDSDTLRARYGAIIGGKNILRGWWVDWETERQSRIGKHTRSQMIDTWSFNGIYQILAGDSDTMKKQAMADIFTITEYWRVNSEFTADGAAIHTIVPAGEGGVQYENNTQLGIEMTGSDLYMPVCTIQTFYAQVT